jgi:hypothetical protein
LQITNRHCDDLIAGVFTYIGWVLNDKNLTAGFFTYIGWVVNDKKVVLVALLANQLFAYWLD